MSQVAGNQIHAISTKKSDITNRSALNQTDWPFVSKTVTLTTASFQFIPCCQATGLWLNRRLALGWGPVWA